MSHPIASNFATLDQFELFVELADELAGTRLVATGFSVDLEVRVGGGPVTVKTPIPDEDDFRSFLLALRHFIAEREPTHLYRIYNQIELHINDSTLILAARDSRRVYRAAADGAGLRFPDLSPAEILDLYIDGRYFHADPEKRAKTQGLDPSIEAMYGYFMRSYALETTRQVAVVSNILRKARASGSLH